jgi:hypothetical protein
MVKADAGVSQQIAAPKVIQGIIAAVNDYYTAKLASRLFPGGNHRDVAASLESCLKSRLL